MSYVENFSKVGLTITLRISHTDFMVEEKSTTSFFTIRNFFICVSAVILVGAIVAAAYFYMQYYQTQQLLKNPTLAAQQQTKELLNRLGMLIDLPKNETPTIATVSDVSKLKDQPFFVKAQNGDKVIIYTNAKKAILYRPSENKIMEVAPVNIGNSVSVTPSVSPIPTKKPTPTK